MSLVAIFVLEPAAERQRAFFNNCYPNASTIREKQM